MNLEANTLFFTVYEHINSSNNEIPVCMYIYYNFISTESGCPHIVGGQTTQHIN